MRVKFKWTSYASASLQSLRQQTHYFHATSKTTLMQTRHSKSRSHCSSHQNHHLRHVLDLGEVQHLEEPMAAAVQCQHVCSQVGIQGRLLSKQHQKVPVPCAQSLRCCCLWYVNTQELCTVRGKPGRVHKGNLNSSCVHTIRAPQPSSHREINL